MVIIDQYWKNKDPVFSDDALIWFTDASRADSGTGSCIYGKRPERSFSFPLGMHAIVFQTEIYAILQCACENIRAYRHKQILIFSDSPATLKALSSPKVTSGLVAECLDALSALASWNEVTLVWVPGHCGIPGNEKADKLAKRGAATPLLGPEYLGVQQEKKNWIKCQHRTTWNNLPGHRHGNLLLVDHVRKELTTYLN
jgi:ribonuclease HI